jgi:outer membrane protein assembly factor BamE (lipoprotein component of BamABCDE complex)
MFGIVALRDDWPPVQANKYVSTRSLEIYAITLLAAVALLAGGCSKRSARGAWTSSASIIIEPGVSIGLVRSGMTIQQVVAELGEPDRKKESALEYLNLGFSVIPGKEGVVHIVLCVDPTGKEGPFRKAFAGRTKEGIGMGSSRAEVIRAYGEPTATETIDGKPAFEVVRYRPHGLVFELRNGRVDSIGVIFNPPE